jgi:GT2 family glycosyltransferase
MRFPTLWNCLCDALRLYKLFAKRPHFGGQLMADFDWDMPRDLEVLNGWFWLVRREAIEEVGLLDERFFMYGEDVDWCRRFWNAGWRVRFDPGVEAVHYGGGSSEQSPLRFYLEMQRAKLQYWRKHNGVRSVRLYAGVLALHHLLRVAAHAGCYLVRRGDSRVLFKIQRSVASLRFLLLNSGAEKTT